MSEWLYRRGFTITNNTLAPVTDLQIKFQVYRSAGTSTGTAVYIGTNCLEDFSDVRFTDSSGIDTGLYDYWIETPTTSTVATCWVEVGYLPASAATTCYVYYGNNNGVSAYSSGSHTFPFFDDFSGTSVDESKWTVSGAGVTVADSIVSISGAETIISVSSFAANTAAHARYKTAHYNTTSYTERIQWLVDWNNGAFVFPCGPADWNKKYRTANSGKGSTAAITLWAADTFKTLEIIRKGSTSVIFKVDGSTDLTSTTYVNTGNWIFNIGNESSSPAASYLDWIFVRKYAATEPTVSGWIAAEDLTVDDDTPTGYTTTAYRIVGIEYDQNKGVFIIEFGAVEDYYMTQDAKYRGAYNNTLSLL